MDQNSQTEVVFKSVRSQPDMSEVFNEGGITDDGLAVDPISGNEIPAGSMAEEVRDDITAQLSGGEYVVPADVLRFYGVKFFEELRAEAKMGLNQMEDEGRIGGEPVGMEGDKQPLSMEEEAELNAIMGMAMGGLMGQSYSAPVASAPNPSNPTSPMYDPMSGTEMQNNIAGYGGGGGVPANTQVNFPDFSTYQAGYSFMGDPATAAQTPGISASKNVTLYGPNGEVVPLILPQDQARYDKLLAQGYSRNPTTGTTTPNNTDISDPDKDSSVFAKDRERQLDDSRFGSRDLTAMMEDPLAYGASMIDGGRLTSVNSRTAGLAGSLLGGPVGSLIGGVAGAFNTGNNISEAKAASLMADYLGYDNTKLESDINEYVGGLRGLEKRMAAGALERGNAVYNQRIADALNPAVGGGATREDFGAGDAGDLAFNRSMESVAQEGTAYNPTTGSYKSTGSTAVTTSKRPQSRPTSSTPSPSSSPSSSPSKSPSSGGGGLYQSITGTAFKDTSVGQAVGGGCFLTTAVVDYRGEPDNGVTLTTLRTFRDTYLSNKDGEVRRYYDIAPKIVAAIPRDHKAWDWIGKRVDKSVEYINEGKNYLAYRTYKRMVEKLERDWLMEK